MSKRCSKCKKDRLMEQFISENREKPYSCCNDCRLKCVSQTNKCNVCGISANFNFKGEKYGVKCIHHKDPEMVNVHNTLCKYENCTIRASFGFENDKKASSCYKHKEPTMISLNKVYCKFENCKKKPCFGREKDKIPIFCKEHKTEDMQDISHQKCQYENCNTRPSFGLIGEPIKFCKKHKTSEMKELVNKKCEQNECGKNPSYNFSGAKKARFCKEHQLENMVDVKHIFCLENGCEKRPTYNLSTEKKPLYCRLHKKDGMIDICNKHCAFEDCVTQPRFNFEGMTRKFCFQHKEAGMIDLVFTPCKEPNCQKHPNYNYENESVGIYCNSHKLENMVDVKHNFCKADECRKRANFNLPGIFPEFCATHKKDGMLANPRRKCEGSVDEDCKESATHGIKEPLHCEEHALPDEYDLTEHPCKKCEKIDVLNKEGLCVNFCSLEERDRVLKKQVKKHEEFINKLLDEEIDIKPILKDQSPDRQCTLKRPDRVYHMGSHVVIIEIDEDQHKSYKCTAFGDSKEGKIKAEKIRMYEISQSFPEFPPCIWIRYNPDNFKDKDGKSVKVITSKRHDILVKWVKRCLRDDKTNGVKVKYLFYDEYKETDGSFENIEKADVI
jgi:EsV-1-7 cysteine-rich motif